MSTSYSSLLRLELPGNGEQSGTWGSTTNNNFGNLIDQAIAGTASITMLDADYTLSAYNGVTDESRQMILNIGGALTADRNIICPSTSKLYVIKNNTTGNRSVTLKTASGTGVTVTNGNTTIAYCDNTNVVDSVTSLPAGTTVGTLPIVTTTGTQTLTNKTLTSPKVGTAIVDTNGNSLINLTATGGAVNYMTVANAATTGSPSITATGSDSNIDLLLVSKNSGVVKADGVEVVVLTGSQTLTDKTLSSSTIVSPSNISATTGNSAVISATGPDTDINISVTPKGSGKFLISGNTGLGTSSPDALLSVNGVASFGAGTVSAPSIAAFGDLNTGIWFPAANTVSIATNGTEDFRFGSSGQFGIGGATYGTSGQVFTSGGPSSPPTWTDKSTLISEASIATTSGTAQGYTTIPAGVRRITVSFFDVTNSNDIAAQLGTSSGYVITGYSSISFTQGGSNSYSNGFGMRNSGSGAYGIMTITNIGGNDWVSSHSVRDCAGGGRVSLSGVLTSLRIVGSGGGSFTGGKFNIMYE